jgi:hypothetical protein
MFIFPQMEAVCVKLVVQKKLHCAVGNYFSFTSLDAQHIEKYSNSFLSVSTSLF